MERNYTDVIAEMERRETYLKALPGERLREDMEAMQRCLYIFARNEVELSSHIHRFLRSETHAPDVSQDYINELIRLLHNFLTSVTTLIDSQRVVMRHRWPSEDKGERSQFETGEYREQVHKVFETGEAEFMTRFRNYCTHYNIPVPGLSTTLTWNDRGRVEQTNELKLDRDSLLRWSHWGAASRAFLLAQPEQFPFAPVIQSYIRSTQAFFGWFWQRVSGLSATLIDDRNAKATEVRLWWEEVNLEPGWLADGLAEPPPGWSGRRDRAKKRQLRYQHGTRGFRISVVDSNGVVEIGTTDWTSLPR